MKESSSEPIAQPLTPISVSLALLTSALWGGNAVATRFALDGMPPLAAAGVRFTLATAFMLVWCCVERTRLKLRSNQWLPVVVMGILLFLQIGTFNLGLQSSNASHAVLLVNTSIFWVLLIEQWFFRTHKLTGKKIVGVALAFCGMALVILTGSETDSAVSDSPSLEGDAILAVSSLILGIKIVYTRQAVRQVEPGALIFWHDVIGTILLFLASVCFESPEWKALTVTMVLALLYQGLLVGGFCFGMNAVLLKKHLASQIAVFAFAAPLFGVVLAQLLRDDPLTPWLPVATVCVTGGIVLANWRDV